MYVCMYAWMYACCYVRMYLCIVCANFAVPRPLHNNYNADLSQILPGIHVIIKSQLDSHVIVYHCIGVHAIPRDRHMTDSTQNATLPKSTNSKNLNSSLQIFINPKF